APTSTTCPYTTLFRSKRDVTKRAGGALMGRPRQYGSDAERQRAFRQRQEQTIARVDRGALDRHHARLDQLQAALRAAAAAGDERSEEHTSELQSRVDL